MDRLTERQGEVYNYVRRYIDLNEYPPTIAEIADHLGVCGNSAYGHIKALRRKGYLTTAPGKVRTLRIVV